MSADVARCRSGAAMAVSLRTVRLAVLRRLNDTAEAFWTGAEVDGYLRQGYRELARLTRVVWDMVYLENLPAGFSVTASWELAFATFRYGTANYTMADERRLLNEAQAIGPANYTSPFEFTRGHLEDAGASTAIPAVADLPASVTEIDRPLYDLMAIETITPRDAMRHDSRFEVTEGEPYALIAKADGIRTVRKVRVPAQSAQTHTINGSWGIVRDTADISEGTVTGTWGFPRRIPGHHPMGAESFGFPRRPYKDEQNVRVEVWREGRVVDADTDAFEVPDRSTVYLRDYALHRSYAKTGPAQDLRLADHYRGRYQRGVARLQRRVQAQQRERVSRLGGGGVTARTGPPRPSLPWQYGVTVR